MRKSLLIAITLFGCYLATAATAMQSAGITFKENLLFVAKMDGAHAIPAVSTGAKGLGSFMLNKTRNAISVNMSLAMLSGTPTSVSIYEGAEGINGTLLLDLTPYVIGNRVATVISGTDVTANLGKYFNDELYVLVKTDANPSGEIRGQIKLETDLNFAADLNGMETIPMIMVSTAYGLGSFGLSMDNANLNFKVICQGLTGPMTGAKLYIGTTGMVGEQISDLTPFINGNVITGTITPSAAMLSSLLAGEIYLNITTAANPTGELRAQLVNYKGLTFDGILDGSQMVPPVATAAQGVCVIRFSPDLTTMYYDIVVDGVASSIDYCHLHIGSFGQPYNSSSYQVDFTPTIDGNRIRGTKTNISAANKDRLLTSKLALLIHTGDYPQGEIRSQVVRYAREGFTIKMDGQQVVPSASTQAYGSGIVSISRDEANAHYNWLAANLAAVPTDSHFKNNVAGQNGSVMYHIGPAMNISGNNASADGFWTNADATPFLPTHSAAFSTDSVYLDIQNSVFPNGEIRGQVLDDYVTYTLASKQFATHSAFVAYPNPASRNLTISNPGAVDSKSTIELFDLLGRRTFVTQMMPGNSHESTIDISGLSRGNYILKVSADGHSSAQKITLN